MVILGRRELSMKTRWPVFPRPFHRDPDQRPPRSGIPYEANNRLVRTNASARVENIHSRPGCTPVLSGGEMESGRRYTCETGSVEVSRRAGHLPGRSPFGRMLRFYKNCTVFAVVTVTAFGAKPLAGIQALQGVSGVVLAHASLASSTHNTAMRCSEQSLPKGGDAEPRGFGAFLCIMPAEPPAWGPRSGRPSLAASCFAFGAVSAHKELAMTYTHKLARRLARLRSGAFTLGTALSLACSTGEGDVLSPSTSSGREYSVLDALRGRDRSHNKRIVSFRVVPDTANLEPLDTTTFSVLAKLGDGTSTSVKVNWKASGGSIDSTGKFTADSRPGTYHVVATTRTGTLGDTAVVIEPTSVDSAPGNPTAILTAITLTPGTISLTPGARQQFRASGRWSDGSATTMSATYSATGGTITSTGLYSAGSTAGSYRVIATDQARSLADTALLTIEPPAAPEPAPPTATLVDITLTPASVSLTSGDTQRFTVSGSWSDGSASPLSATFSATGGAISSTGLYSAGSAAGGYRVIATDETGSLADTALVTIESPPAPPASGGCDIDKSQLTFYGNFEEPSPWSIWRLDEARSTDGSTPWALDLRTTPVRECDQAARIELRKNDGLIADNHRHEIKLQSTGAGGGNGGVPVPAGVTPIGRLGSEVWWGWSVYIPSNWVFESGWAPETIMQVVQAGRSPAFSLGIDGANFYTETRYGHGSQGSSTITVVRTSTSSITRGAWADFVVHAKWSSGGDGILEIWKDGRQIVNRQGPTAYSDWSSAPYPKWGIYKWSWANTNNSIVTERDLLIDAVRVTDAAHGSYDVVAPR